MSEEIIPENDLLQIIDSSLAVLATLFDIKSDPTYPDEQEDINTVKKNTFRIIYAAQRKLLKQIKEG
jgi:hypothetical protein